MRRPGGLPLGLLLLAAASTLQGERRQALAGKIREIRAEAKGRYGSPRLHAALAGADGARSVNTVAKIMRDNDIRAKMARRFRCKTTDSNHPSRWRTTSWAGISNPSGPNKAWVADITYIPTAEGWLYLAIVEDLFSRMIVGWSMADHMEIRLVVDALNMAVEAAGAGGGPAFALRPRKPICQRALPAAPGEARDRVQHERGRAVLG